MSPSAAPEAVAITHPDRVVFPAMHLTKADVADYYRAAARLMMPYIAGRPLTLVRCPQGRLRDCFYQKHANEGWPDLFRKVAVRESKGEVADYLYIDRPEGLLAGVQFGVLEFHVWGATVADIERPERVVFDLDPDPSVPFTEVRRTAFEMRDFLAELGLAAFPMLTGGKGVHVIAPLAPRLAWPQVKEFAHRVARTMAEHAPGRFVATMSKARRRGRIYIDYLRNERGATFVSPYSTRARSGAPVSTPLDWDELSPALRSDHYTISDLPTRLRRLQHDPWADFFAVRQSITAAMLRSLTTAS
jgi:bifunctional non-homologous end joining protein LigD